HSHPPAADQGATLHDHEPAPPCCSKAYLSRHAPNGAPAFTRAALGGWDSNPRWTEVRLIYSQLPWPLGDRPPTGRTDTTARNPLRGDDGPRTRNLLGANQAHVHLCFVPSGQVVSW